VRSRFAEAAVLARLQRFLFVRFVRSLDLPVPFDLGRERCGPSIPTREIDQPTIVAGRIGGHDQHGQIGAMPRTVKAINIISTQARGECADHFEALNKFPQAARSAHALQRLNRRQHAAEPRPKVPRMLGGSNVSPRCTCIRFRCGPSTQ